MLRADGEADGIGMDVLILQLLRAQLGVRGGRRMDDQRLDIGYVGQQREDLQRRSNRSKSIFKCNHAQKQNNRGARLGPRSSAKQ